MSPKSVILEKFRSLDTCLERIRTKVGKDCARLDDPDIQDICVLNLQRACQITIDVAGIVLRDKKLVLPNTLREYFELLGKQQILSANTADRLARMVGFRNIAVHDYEKVDIAVLKAIVQGHLPDFEQFQRELLVVYGTP